MDRSRKLSPTARGYGRDWQKLRDWHRARYPLCAYCLKAGKVRQADVVDHIVPFRQAPHLRLDASNLQSLCHPCHSRIKQREDKGRQAIGPDGWPIAEAPAPRQRHGFSIPHGLQRSNVLVHLVCGAPASGKTTFARENAKPDDVIIDLDDLRVEAGGTRYDRRLEIRKAAFAKRDKMLRALASRTDGEAWLVVMAPTAAERHAWKMALGKVKMHVLRTSAKECISRIKADPERAEAAQDLIASVIRWHEAR